MKAIQPYLMFNGNCREAMEFYKTALGGELSMTTFAEMPGAPPAEGATRVMHARITDGAAVLMASDTLPGSKMVQSDSVQVSISCDSREEEERIFAALSDGAEIMLPLQDMFWGSHFGMLTDKFGVRWMLDLPLPVN